MKVRNAEGCGGDAADAAVDEMVVGWGMETGRIGGAVEDAIVVDQGGWRGERFLELEELGRI